MSRLASEVRCQFEVGSFPLRKAPRVRTPAVFARAFGLDPDCCSLADVFRASGLPSTMADLPQLCTTVARTFLQHHCHLPPPLEQTGVSLLTWNLTSLSTRATDKLRFLKGFVSKNIVALQETKLTEIKARAVQLLVTPSLLLHTAALGTDALLGGVATLIPTYLAKNVQSFVLVPGYALLVSLSCQGAPLCVLNVYLPPGKESVLLRKTSAELRKHAALLALGTCVVVGDFNRIFESLIGLTSLRNLTFLMHSVMTMVKDLILTSPRPLAALWTLVRFLLPCLKTQAGLTSIVFSHVRMASVDTSRFL